MTVWSSYGLGRVTTGDADLFVGPKNYRADGSIRGVIYTHGHGQSAAYANDSVNAANQTAIVQAIARKYPVVACDFGGNQWGNAVHVARIAAAVTWLQGTWGAKAGKVLLGGVSMGNGGNMAYAAANPSNVAGIFGITPLSDLQEFVTDNTGGFAAEINGVYGGAYSDATYGNAHNPVKIAQAGGLGSIPIKLWYASDDVIVLPSTVQAFGAAQASATLVNLGSVGGHTEGTIGHVPIADILTFLAANS